MLKLTTNVKQRAEVIIENSNPYQAILSFKTCRQHADIEVRLFI